MGTPVWDSNSEEGGGDGVAKEQRQNTAELVQRERGRESEEGEERESWGVVETRMEERIDGEIGRH